MSPVIPEETITLENVQLALKYLRSGEFRKTPPLSPNLLIVRQTLPDPSAKVVPALAVSWMLQQVVSEEFERLRKRMGLRLPSRTETYDDLLMLIERDGRTNNHLLIGWSWVYHHYTIPDFSTLAREFAQKVRVDTRTLQRHHQRALSDLTFILLQREGCLKLEGGPGQ
jgi:hypothetical protein